MRKLLVALIFLSLICNFVSAQEENNYALAQELIAQAEADGSTELNLMGLGLTNLPPEIGNLTQLSSLRLAFNELSILRPELGNLVHLRSLDLEGNNLTSLPALIGSFTELESLYALSNDIESISGEIGNLQELRVLVLYDNELSALPAEIGNLEKLENLNLSANVLSSLPAEIGNLESLTCLELSYNRLTYLPPQLGYLASLINSDGCGMNRGSLILEGNPLVSPPPEIMQQDIRHILAYLRLMNVICFASAIGDLERQYC